MSNKRSWKQLASGLGVALGATALASLLSLNLSLFKSLENSAADIRIAAMQPPEPQSEQIVVAALTEDTLKQFAYRSPVDREFLAQLLIELEAKGAKAVGLDVLIDSPTEESKDQLLAKTLREMTIPVFVSYTVTKAIVDEDQLAYLNVFVPEKLRAAANLATDPFDGTVRWIFPGENEPGMPMGFARRGAQIVGVTSSKEWKQIAWRPHAADGAAPFKTFPAHAIKVMPKAWFEGKIVLVGAVLSITDKHRTPLAIVDDGDDGVMPGILVQAHGMSQLIENRQPHVITTEKIILVSLLMALIGISIGLLGRGLLISVSIGFCAVLALWLIGFFGFRAGLPLLPLVGPTLSMAFALWMMDMLIGRAERKQRQFIQGAFSRYVAPAVVDRLVENPESLSISGVRQDATFIFSDIAGFTTLSEELPSEKLSEVLNSYLDGGCATVFKYAGTVDKFIGDAIMAVFNAPMPQPDHVSRAVRCALELDAYCEEFRKQQNAQGIKLGITRIGVHSGSATIGNFGSHNRMDFTALGDTVNTAARTEGVNKYFGTRICCTQEVVAKCDPDINFMPIGDVVLKGKITAVTLYTPVTQERADSAYFKDYMAMYRSLSEKNMTHVDVQSTDYTDPQGVAQRVLEMERTYPDEALVHFHAERVKQGLLTTRVVMEDK